VFYPKINKIAGTIKETFDVRRVRAGKPYTILASKDSIEKAQVFIYKHNKINSTIIDFKDSLIIFEILSLVLGLRIAILSIKFLNSLMLPGQS
jgi:hypothetical protein